MTAGLRPLTRSDKAALVAEILWSYARVRWWLRRRDLRTAVTRVRRCRLRPRRIDPLLEPALSFRLGRAVARTVSLLPTDNRCLMRSLVLTSMLARRRMPSSVILAACAEPEFHAHAWVEYNGMPLITVGHERYQRLTVV